MRTIIKYLALAAAFAAVVLTAFKFGLGAAAGGFIALVAFAVYALLDNLDELEDSEDEIWEEFLENLEYVIDEMERLDGEKRNIVIKGGKSDAEDDA